MIEKKILNPARVRRIAGGFGFIQHRFVGDGFLASLTKNEALFYVFLAIVSDRNGLSFYSYDAICTLLKMSLDEYIEARNGIIDKDLLAFDGTIYQVLELPPKPVKTTRPKVDANENRGEGPANIADLLKKCIKEA